jgi:hypothetical protein
MTTCFDTYCVIFRSYIGFVPFSTVSKIELVLNYALSSKLIKH